MRMNGKGQIKMTFESEIKTSSIPLWNRLPEARKFVILEAKYIDIQGTMATYTNPYDASSKPIPVTIEALFDGNQYQSDHVIPINYVKNLQNLHGFSWGIEKMLAFYYDLDAQVLIPKDMNAPKGSKGLLKYCPPFGPITGASDLRTRYQNASLAEKIVVENYCFTWKHIASKWQIYGYLDPSTKNIIKEMLEKAKIARRSPQLINPHY